MRQVVYLQELNRDAARSTEHKILYFHVRPNKYPLLVIVLSQFNAAHIVTAFVVRSILILYFHPCPHVPRNLFSQGQSQKYKVLFLFMNYWVTSPVTQWVQC